MTISIYLARHGQSEWNLDHILMGHHDSPLTNQGKNEALALAISLKSKNISIIFSSDLGRAFTTANIVASELHSQVLLFKGLRERTFGPDYESKSLAYFQKNLATKISTQDNLGDSFRFSYKLGKWIESDLDIFTRFRKTLVLESLKYPNKNILVTSHEGAIRAFMIGSKLRTYAEFPLGSMKNGKYFKISLDNGIFY